MLETIGLAALLAATTLALPALANQGVFPTEASAKAMERKRQTHGRCSRSDRRSRDCRFLLALGGYKLVRRYRRRKTDEQTLATI